MFYYRPDFSKEKQAQINKRFISYPLLPISSHFCFPEENHPVSNPCFMQCNKSFFRIQWIQATPFPWYRKHAIETDLKKTQDSCLAGEDRFKASITEVTATTVDDFLPIAYLFSVAVAAACAIFLTEILYSSCRKCCSKIAKK